MDCFDLEGTEMTIDSIDLIFEDIVIESSFEFALTSRRRGDVHGRLTTSKVDEVLLRCGRRCVRRCVGGTLLEHFEIVSGE